MQVLPCTRTDPPATMISTFKFRGGDNGQVRRCLCYNHMRLKFSASGVVNWREQRNRDCRDTEREMPLCRWAPWNLSIARLPLPGTDKTHKNKDRWCTAVQWKAWFILKLWYRDVQIYIRQQSWHIRIHKLLSSPEKRSLLRMRWVRGWWSRPPYETWLMENSL